MPKKKAKNESKCCGMNYSCLAWILIIIGTLWIVKTSLGFLFHFFWPVLFILIGIYLLHKKNK